MSCIYPRSAFWTRDKDGKRGVAFRSNAPNVISGVPFQVPCGQCVQCRLAYSRQWAVRCMHEYRHWYNKGYDGSFLTLTYDEKHLQEIIDKHGVDTLVLSDLQKFMKRLRKATTKKGEAHDRGVRFYACGEYGSTTNRPHYHVLVFNRAFGDRKFYGNSASGEPIYTSAQLSELWTAGGAKLGDVSFNSCAYVARYIVDKITGEKAHDWYAGRLPEFSTKSNRPGLGKAFFQAFREQLYRDDGTIVDGRELSLPRYYDLEYAKLDEGFIERVKKERRRRAILKREKMDNNRRRTVETFELRKLAVFARKAV